MVDAYWSRHVEDVYALTHGQETVLMGGDGRCDSPGSSAKYCTYTLMESSRNMVVHLETVARDTVHLYFLSILVYKQTIQVAYQSPNMEREALRRSLKYLEDKVNITELVTDASSSIIAMMGKGVDVCLHLLYTSFTYSQRIPSCVSFS